SGLPSLRAFSIASASRQSAASRVCSYSTTSFFRSSCSLRTAISRSLPSRIGLLLIRAGAGSWTMLMLVIGLLSAASAAFAAGHALFVGRLAAGRTSDAAKRAAHHRASAQWHPAYVAQRLSGRRVAGGLLVGTVLGHRVLLVRCSRRQR